MLLVFSIFRLFLFWIFSPLKCWFSSPNRLFIVSILTKCSLMSFIKTSAPSDDKSTKSVGVQLTHVYICFSFQQNRKVGMTVRTCICNVFECVIHCKIYTYLLHLCYISCKLRCWIFVACSHLFLLPNSAFPWTGHPANLLQLFPCCLRSFCIKIDQYEDSIID